MIFSPGKSPKYLVVKTPPERILNDAIARHIVSHKVRVARHRRSKFHSRDITEPKLLPDFYTKAGSNFSPVTSCSIGGIGGNWREQMNWRINITDRFTE